MRASKIALVLLMCAAVSACGKRSSLYLEPGKKAAPRLEEPASRRPQPDKPKDQEQPQEAR